MSAPIGLPSYSASGFLTDNANSHLVTGFAAGLGFDWMLCAGLFMRAEFEYLRFTSTVDTSVNTARARPRLQVLIQGHA